MPMNRLRNIPEPPKLHPNELNAIAIGMRNRGDYYFPQIGQGPLHIRDWLRREFERGGHDFKLMADL